VHDVEPKVAAKKSAKDLKLQNLLAVQDGCGDFEPFRKKNQKMNYKYLQLRRNFLAPQEMALMQ
jgi:hypothetical protein